MFHLFMLVGVFCILILLLYVLISLFFTKTKTRRGSFPSYHVCYLTFTGDYKKINFIALCNKIRDTYGIDPRRVLQFGLYYDKPGTVPVQKQRSAYGFIIPDDMILKEKGDFRIGKIEEISDSFVFEGSWRRQFIMMRNIFVGYKTLFKMIQDNKFEMKSASFEIYDYKNDTMSIIIPLVGLNGMICHFPDSK